MPNVIEEIRPVHVEDVTGQHTARNRSVPSDATVLEVVKQLLGDMEMGAHDSEGRPLNYHALLEREGRQLGDNERAGDVLKPDDTIRLLPNIDAG